MEVERQGVFDAAVVVGRAWSWELRAGSLELGAWRGERGETRGRKRGKRRK